MPLAIAMKETKSPTAVASPRGCLESEKAANGTPKCAAIEAYLRYATLSNRHGNQAVTQRTLATPKQARTLNPPPTRPLARPRGRRRRRRRRRCPFLARTP